MTASRRWRCALAIAVGGAATFLAGQHAVAQEATESLAAAAQNPVAAMYSLPFQDNTYFGAGPGHDKTANVLNIQPVLQFTVGQWNIISRTIAPLIYVPSVNTGFGAASLGDDTTAAAGPRNSPETFGLGDINQTFYFSPAVSSPFIWGVGPSINLPTATSAVIGSGKLSVGPAAVGLVMPKPWVIGALARQLFSIAGPNGRTDVNQTLLQPFVNYNLPDGWYLTSSPTITANWSAASLAALDRPGRRRRGQDLQDRWPANQCRAPGFRLCKTAWRRAKLGGPFPGATAVPAMMPLAPEPRATPASSSRRMGLRA
jgi:hypothetical protein